MFYIKGLGAEGAEFKDVPGRIRDRSGWRNQTKMRGEKPLPAIKI